MSDAPVQWGRGVRIIPHLVTIVGWSDPEDRVEAPANWGAFDVAHRERRVQPPCMICGEPSGFCRVVEIDGETYWGDLCGDHMDPDRLLGLD